MENKKLNENNLGQVSGGTIETGSNKYYSFTYVHFDFIKTTAEEIANFLSTEAMRLHGLSVSAQQILNTEPGITSVTMSRTFSNRDTSINFWLVFDSNNNYIGMEGD